MTSPQKKPKEVPTDKMPHHVAVFRCEADIPKIEAHARQHSYRLWGSGSGRRLWSDATTQALDETRWAPAGRRYPPRRYLVVLCSPCAECSDLANCPHTKQVSGPILIDPKATPRGEVLTKDEYQQAERKWQDNNRNQRALAARAAARETSQLGPLSLLHVTKDDAAAALALLEAPHVDLAELKVRLKAITKNVDLVIGKLQR